MDGVLVHEEEALPGADRFLAALREHGRPFLVLTNNSIYTRRDLDRLAGRRRTSWNELAAGHHRVHEAIVAGAGAPRIARAYAALSTELDLFLSQIRPVWTRERLGPDHLALVADLEREGPDVLREHMAQALQALHANPPGRD